jgi:phosphoserine aminotransferase
VKINFTPGPSQLYFTVEGHARQAFREGIPSISHRSKTFESIYQQVTEGLKNLLGIPDHFHIFFTGSATEIWERSIQNLVEQHSFHFVNGAFSKRYFEIAQQLNRNAVKNESAEGFAFSDFHIPGDMELIALTHNETSTGVSLTTEFIHAFREKFPKALIIVDAVSSLPYPQFDYTKIDSVFFSVQKAFGLPAGLGVWIVNEKCLTKSETLLSKGANVGTYHNLPTLLANAKKNQTPETPNVLGIYLLSKVVDDFLAKGIQTIRRETEYKAAILYNALQNHSLMSAFVKQKSIQSQTVIVAETGNYTEQVTNALLSKGMIPGEGYGSLKKQQLRFANFPTHSKEQFELLVDTLIDFKG